MRQALLLRYSLLTYLNTLMIDANLTGAPLWRPVWFEFSDDERTWTIEEQAMVGPALLAAPVTRASAQHVDVYLPDTLNTLWYDYHTHQRIEPSTSSNMTRLNATYTPNATIPLLIRGGHILTTQPPQLTTTATYTQPLTVIAALNATGGASGYVYLDDGTSLAAVDGALYQTLRFAAGFNVTTGRGLFNVTGYVEIDGGYDVSGMWVESIVLIGVTATQRINLTLGGGDLGLYCMTLNESALTHTNHSLIVRLPPQLMTLTADWTLSFDDGCVLPFHAIEANSLAVPIAVLALLALLIIVALIYTHLTRRKQQMLNEQYRMYQSGQIDQVVTGEDEEDGAAAVTASNSVAECGGGQ